MSSRPKRDKTKKLPRDELDPEMVVAQDLAGTCALGSSCVRFVFAESDMTQFDARMFVADQDKDKAKYNEQEFNVDESELEDDGDAEEHERIDESDEHGVEGNKLPAAKYHIIKKQGSWTKSPRDFVRMDIKTVADVMQAVRNVEGLADVPEADVCFFPVKSTRSFDIITLSQDNLDELLEELDEEVQKCCSVPWLQSFAGCVFSVCQASPERRKGTTPTHRRRQGQDRAGPSSRQSQGLKGRKEAGSGRKEGEERISEEAGQRAKRSRAQGDGGVDQEIRHPKSYGSSFFSLPFALLTRTCAQEESTPLPCCSAGQSVWRARTLQARQSIKNRPASSRTACMAPNPNKWPSPSRRRSRKGWLLVPLLLLPHAPLLLLSLDKHPPTVKVSVCFSVCVRLELFVSGRCGRRFAASAVCCCTHGEAQRHC